MAKATPEDGYALVLEDIARLIAEGRRRAAHTVNVAMTATYWQIGKRIVEAEQRGATRADYGEELIERLSRDLSKRAGRGFGARNLAHMRKFFLAYPHGSTDNILQTTSAKSGGQILQTLSAKSSNVAESQGMAAFPLPWSHYTLLLAVKNENARRFYEAEALRGGWTFRQLERQIDTQFYERAAMSTNKVAMLRKGEKPRPEDAI